MQTRVHRRLVVLLLGVGAGCRPGSAPPPSAPVPPPHASAVSAVSRTEDDADAVAEEAAAQWDAIEAAQLDDELRTRFEIVATGAVDARLSGRLVLTDTRVELEARGTFAGEPLHVELRRDGRGVTGGHVQGGPRFDLPELPHLREALVLGMTRMGLLHTIALLRAGRPPEGAEAGVRQWVQVQDVAASTETGTAASSGSPSATALSFALVVAGQRSGHATVWVQAGSLRLLQRRQTVAVGQDEMRVDERYVALDAG